MSICLNCGKENKHGPKFCSKKCSWQIYNKLKYLKNKQYFKDKAKRWEEEHPRKRKLIQKKAMSKYFKSTKGKEAINRRNKIKLKCCALTRRLLKKEEKRKLWSKKRKEFYIYTYKNKKQIFPKKVCKECGSRKNLELHHEKYSATVKEIIEDWEKGLIYYLCRKHHRGLHKNNK